MNLTINEKRITLFKELSNGKLGLEFNSSDANLGKYPYKNNGLVKDVIVRNININLKDKQVYFNVDVNFVTPNGFVAKTVDIVPPSFNMDDFLSKVVIDENKLVALVINHLVKDMELANKVLDDSANPSEVEPYTQD